jgi:hypothetical protein
MNNRGIVLEIQDKQLIVMRSTGQIDCIPRGKRVCEVGEEIVYVIPTKSSVKGLIVAIVGLSAALVASFLLVLKLAGVTSTDEVIAYVSLDVKPSIEIGIDENEIVREMRVIGNGDETWIRDIKYEDKSLEDVTAAILDKAEKGVLSGREGDIVIGASVKVENAELSDIVLETKMKEQVTKHIQDTHPNNAKDFIIVTFAVPDELRRIGNVQGLSMGQYAIYLKMKSGGDHLSFETIKASTLRELDAEVEGLIEMLTSDQSMSKAVLSELLQDEKAGKLDEDLANQGSTIKPKATPKPTSTLKPTTKPTGSPTSSPKSSERPDRSSKPTQTPSNSAKPTSKPENTKKPTNTPKDSSEPSPTTRPETSPKATPKPTPKPTVKPTPKPTQTPESSGEPSVG